MPPLPESIITVLDAWYSSANTLIMNRLEFSCEQLSKCPEVMGQPGRHGGGTWPPPGLNHGFTYPLVQRDRCSQTHVGSGKEGLKKTTRRLICVGVLHKERLLRTKGDKAWRKV